MQVSLNTYKPYTQSYGINNKQQNKNINFKSGYGAEEFTPVDNPELPTHTESERWRNILEGIKMMTIDHYKETHYISPKKPAPLFTPEEAQQLRREYYKGTPLEGKDPNEWTPEEPEENPNRPYMDEFDDY